MLFVAVFTVFSYCCYIHFYHIKISNVLHQNIYQHFFFFGFWVLSVLNISFRARGVSAVAILMHQCLLWILLHGMIQVKKKLGFAVERGNLQCQDHWEKGGHRDPILLLSLADLLALQNDLYSRKGNFAPLLVLYGTSMRVALSVNGKIRLSWHQAAQISVPAVHQSCVGNTHKLPCT